MNPGRFLLPLESAKQRQSQPRDRKREDFTSTRKLAHTLSELRDMRTQGELTREICRVAQALVLCGLPYVPTEKTRIVRKVRLGDGSTLTVVFSAALENKMPYGSDRTLLYWMVDKAIKHQSPFISWRRATEFLRDLGLAESGKNRKDLKERFNRLSGLTIGITRRNGDDSLLLPLIEEKSLPPSLMPKAAPNNTREGDQDHAGDVANLPPIQKVAYGFKLSDRLFKDILAHNIPIPLKLLQKTRKQSQMQDLMIFLYWRSYAAQTETLINWQTLENQLAHDDATKRRIRVRFRRAISMLRTIWPELRADARRNGLSIGPPHDGIQFLTDLQHKRQLER